MGRPEVLAPDDPVPAPFTGRVHARLDATRGESTPLALKRHHAAGYPVGEPTGVVTVRSSPRDPSSWSMAWSGSHFLVAYSDWEPGGWHVAIARVRCAE